MIRVLVVDDSAAFRALLRMELERHPDLQVVGEAAELESAVRLTRTLRPDVATMDLKMPGGSGLDAISRIMAIAPLPIILLSGEVDPRNQQQLLEATRAGAVALETKPSSAESREWLHLRQLVHALADVKVMARRSAEHRPLDRGNPGRRLELVAIGASTGGPPAIYKILEALPAGTCTPVVLAQHLARGFTSGLATWLSSGCRLPVRIADAPISLAGPVVVIPADGQHLVVERGLARSVRAVAGEISPGVDVLFNSVAGAYGGSAVGVLLTGMGTDGARGLGLMRDRGARTLAQDAESSVVYGMPRAAAEGGAVCEVLSLAEISKLLNRLVQTAGGDDGR